MALKKGVSFLVLGIIFLVLSFVPLYAFLPSLSYWEGRLTLGAQSDANVNLGFFIVGSNVRVEILAQDITIHLADPSKDIIQKEEIDGLGYVFFHVHETGYYDITFDNKGLLSPSRWFPKDVLWKVYYYLYSDLFLVLGPIFLVVGTIVLARYWYKTRRPTPRKIYCRHCGTENPEDAVFCQKCGKKVR